MVIINKSNEKKRIEGWLITLMQNYHLQPTKRLANNINYYIARLLTLPELSTEGSGIDYLKMQKYWAYQANLSRINFSS